MSDYVGDLERALRDAAIREYRAAGPTPAASTHGLRAAPVRDQAHPRARSRRAGLWRRWSPLAWAAGGLLIAGSAAAAIVGLGGNSAPLTGTVPGVAEQLLHYDIPLTPDLEPGNAGWCSYPRFSVRNAAPLVGGGTCSPASPPDAPVILGAGEPVSNASDLFQEAHLRLSTHVARVGLFWMVVISNVEAVRLRAADVVVSRRDPRLPSGWRAVVAFVPSLERISPVPLDAGGRPISQPARLPGRAPAAAGAVSATRSYDPGGVAPSPCSIHADALPSVTSQWEVVATTAPALGSAVMPNVLFSCARIWFSVKGQSQAPSAAVLLNAQNPGRRAPGLPGLKATTQSGVFSEDGGTSGEILAKRVGHAWLVIQGQSVQLSKALLNTLRVEGSSIH